MGIDSKLVIAKLFINFKELYDMTLWSQAVNPETAVKYEFA